MNSEMQCGRTWDCLQMTLQERCALMGMEAGKEGERSPHLYPTLSSFSLLVSSTERQA